MVWEGVKDKEWSGQGSMFTPHVYVTSCSFGWIIRPLPTNGCKVKQGKCIQILYFEIALFKSEKRSRGTSSIISVSLVLKLT